MTATVRTYDGGGSDAVHAAPNPPGGTSASGTPSPDDVATALRRARESSRGFVWVHLDDPREEALHGYDAALGLHPLAVEDLVVGRQRPKLERYAGEHGGSLLVSVRPASYDDARSAVETGEVLVVLGDRWVLTVARDDDRVVDRARDRLGAEGLGLGAVSVLHAVLDVVVDAYVAISTELEDDVSRLEAEVFSPGSRGDGTTSRVYQLKREALELLRAVRPLVEPARRLWQQEEDLVPPSARVFLRDIADHVVQAAESVEATDRQLGDVHSAHLAEVGLRQNADARRISAWAALAAVPTLVAGVYGMNFAVMPELAWRWGYPAALLLMLTVCLVLHRAFRRSGWL